MPAIVSALLLILGVVVVAAAVVDVAWTTMAAGSGGGPVTRRVAARVWQASLRLSARTGRRGLLSSSGAVVVIVVLLTWICSILLGWALVFNAGERAVVTVASEDPASTVERIYYAGYTVFTLGNGELRPDGTPWQLATVAAAGSGLVIVTLSIAYLIPIASAVAQRRQLASMISSLGTDPHEILIRSWTGTDFGLLAHRLGTISALLQLARQQHYAYPVLHYFHSHEPENAIAPNLANLSDALTMLDAGVVVGARPDVGTRRSVNATIDAFLDTLHAAYIEEADDPRPLPPLGPLTDAGVPTVETAAYDAAAERLLRRRRLLAALMRDDGRDLV